MKCNHCQKQFSFDAIDSDGLCYDCANLDPDYILDTGAIVKELVENTIEKLARAKDVSSLELKCDLIAGNMISQVNKKKSDPGKN